VAQMLEDVLRYLKNWFASPEDKHYETYTVKNGGIELPFLHEGQYFRVIGSTFNDGLYKYPANDMQDESFEGSVWALKVPPAVIALANEIAAWQEKNGEQAVGPFTSESFGGYSYTKAIDAKTGGAVTWESAFRSRLNKWRKL